MDQTGHYYRGRTSVVRLMDVMLNELLLMERLASRQAFLVLRVRQLCLEGKLSSCKLIILQYSLMHH